MNKSEAYFIRLSSDGSQVSLLQLGSTKIIATKILKR